MTMQLLSSILQVGGARDRGAHRADSHKRAGFEQPRNRAVARVWCHLSHHCFPCSLPHVASQSAPATVGHSIAWQDIDTLSLFRVAGNAIREEVLVYWADIIDVGR